MRVAFTTLGCKVNQYETEVLKEQFANRGYQVVDSDQTADIYVVNSCTVTASGDKKTRQILRRLGRQNPSAKLVLTGCMPQAYPEVADRLPEADVITGSTNRQGLLQAVEDCMATQQRIIRIQPHQKGELFEKMQAAEMDGHTRAFLKIQDGCDRYCSYCIIPFARGPIRSRPLDELKMELTRLSLSGYKEAVLVGINLSLYGRDLGTRLTDGVALACTTQGIERVRLGSIEPELFTPEDISSLAQWPALCPQFHLSLQSGCDATLARMNRHYTTAEYRRIVEQFRACWPDAAITTDIMVGFPGETAEEFAQTLAFVESIGLARAHIFSYSPRPGTAAARMANQVTPQEKEERSRALIAVTDRTRLQFFQQQVGSTQPVLFEAKEAADFVVGYTPNYTPVTVAYPGTLQGEIRQVTLTGADSEGCTGIFAL